MLSLLIPYALLVLVFMLLYKVYSPGHPEQSVSSAIIKCLPILYLIALLSLATVFDDHMSRYKIYLILGLIASMGGDFFLTWFKKLFIPGVLCFGVAHIFYTIAFTFNPLRLDVGLLFAIFAVAMSSWIVSGMTGKMSSIRPLVVAYVVMISTMGWRAAVYYLERGTNQALAACLGAAIFMISDSVIAISQWKYRFDRAVFVIMLTYYLAQMCIALSVIIPTWDSKAKFVI